LALLVNLEGGFMRKFAKLAAAVATSGIAVFGSFAASGGVANAAVDQPVADCSTGSSGLLSLNVFPSCSSDGSTAINPSSITVTANPSFFNTLGALPGITALLALLNQSLSEDITYTLNCSVNGQTATYNGSFSATAANQSQTVSMQTAVGSPQPGNCQVTDLSATSLVSISTPLLILLGGTKFDFGVSATVNTGVSGAIYANNGTTAKGAGASTCLDDANNGNAGSKIQAYQCNSDLAQFWIQSSTHQIVRNGVCLTQNGANATLAKCSGTNHAQVWDVNGTGGSTGEIVNESTNQCLTMASPKNFSQITVKNCTGAATQKWTGPAPSHA
jgi:Ricin-type beta-trefoil lectin domain